MIKKMKGLPWEPVPGRQSQHVPVMIGDDGTVLDEEAENVKTRPKFAEEEDPSERRYMKNPDQLHVSKKAIAKFGTTEGCPGCDAIIRRGHTAGRLGYNHSKECRARIMEAMIDDPEYQHLIQKNRGSKDCNQLEMITDEQRLEQVAHAKRAM